MSGEVVKLYALDKEDLIYLVKGNSPHFDIFDHELIKDKGIFSDQYGWNWYEYELKELQTHELYMIHKLCKDSWQSVKKRRS